MKAPASAMIRQPERRGLLIAGVTFEDLARRPGGGSLQERVGRVLIKAEAPEVVILEAPAREEAPEGLNRGASAKAEVRAHLKGSATEVKRETSVIGGVQAVKAWHRRAEAVQAADLAVAGVAGKLAKEACLSHTLFSHERYEPVNSQIID